MRIISFLPERFLGGSSQIHKTLYADAADLTDLTDFADIFFLK
jgi:hypothetical protein